MDRTDEIIQEALQQEQREKEARRQQKDREGAHTRPDAALKGRAEANAERKKSTVRVEDVDTAKGQRALKRKEREAGLEVAVDDIEGAEEDLQVEEEGEFMAFNLKEERETGYFDESGFYVENKEKDKEEEADAWLTSDAGQVVSAEVLKKIQERQKKETEAEDHLKEISQSEMASVRGEMAALMMDGETVARALKRLGGKRAPPSQQNKRKKSKEDDPPAESPAEEAERKAKFNRLTEFADVLTRAGETDIYGETREELARAAELFGGRGRAGAAGPAGPSLPRVPPATAKGPVGLGLSAVTTTAVAVGGAGGPGLEPTNDEASASEDDMFADSDDEEVKAKRKAREERKKQKTVATVAAAAAAPQSIDRPPAAATAPAAAAPPQPSPTEEEEEDYGAWPVRELQRFVQERGEDPRKFTERSDLIARVRELARNGPEGDVGPLAAPPGYVFNPQTGLFFNAETRMHYDAKSGYYGQGGKWFYWDGVQFVEYAAAGPG